MFHSIMFKVRACELDFGGCGNRGGCSLCCCIMVVQQCAKFKLKISKETGFFFFLNYCAVLSDMFNSSTG